MNPIQATMSSVANVPYTTERWHSHNCPGCIHNGQPRPDTKGRGGIRFSNDGSFAFSCFNCGYKAFWKPGMIMPNKVKNLAQWYGASTKNLMELVMNAETILQEGDFDEYETTQKNLYEKIIPKELPEQAKPFSYWLELKNTPPKFTKVLNKIAERNFGIIEAFDLYWTPEKENELNERFIIPFSMYDEHVGYTARHIWWDKKKLKYLNKFPSNLIYNFDMLNDETVKDVLVLEGPIDAGLVCGVAVNNFEMKINQIELFKKSNKNIIIVPDRDKDGKTMAEQAVRNGFSVAMPQWGTYIGTDGLEHNIKDVEEATRYYGRLFVRHLIQKYTYTDEFKIRFEMARWF